MKIQILTLTNEKKEEIELPEQFNEDILPNLIRKAATIIQSNDKQNQGVAPEAGKRASISFGGKRKSWKSKHGKGISPIPRKVMGGRGTRLSIQGAFIPGTVGGRKAHPPKASKDLEKKINKKENKKAIRSAISATIQKVFVEKNHKLPKLYPFAVEDKVETLTKTKDVMKALEKLGFTEELERVNKRKIRAGKGKTRGRKYQTKRGPAIIVSKECELQKAGRNLQGVEIIKVDSLNADMLSTGKQPGRLTLFTKSAIEKIGKDRLYK